MGGYVWVAFFTNLDTVRVFSTPEAAYDALKHYIFVTSSSDEEYHDRMNSLYENHNWNMDYFGDDRFCHAEKTGVEDREEF